MLEKLNKLLNGEFKVLQVRKWTLDEVASIDGYYDVILCSDDEAHDVCEISTQDFRVTQVNGLIFVHKIEEINKALTELKDMLQREIEVVA